MKHGVRNGGKEPIISVDQTTCVYGPGDTVYAATNWDADDIPTGSSFTFAYWACTYPLPPPSPDLEKQGPSPTPTLGAATGFVSYAWTVSPTTLSLSAPPGQNSTNTSQIVVSLQTTVGAGDYTIMGMVTYLSNDEPITVMLTPLYVTVTTD